MDAENAHHPMTIDERELAEELAGLDALELALGHPPSRLRRVWSSAWPKFVAVALAFGVWQGLVWMGWRDEWVLPAPGTVFSELQDFVWTSSFRDTIATTMRRAIQGYVVAVMIGTLLGLAVARVRPLRTALGSLITGLQTMPSIAWFPLAVLLFQLSEGAVMFVVVLGAAPSIANGLISGVDHVPPLLLRAGRMVGARGFALYRYVILPASLPAFVTGLKQGWAFAWRSLMAAELLVGGLGPSIGGALQNARVDSDAPRLLAVMIVILVMGIVVDTLFGSVDAAIRRRRGLVEHGT